MCRTNLTLFAFALTVPLTATVCATAADGLHASGALGQPSGANSDETSLATPGAKSSKISSVISSVQHDKRRDEVADEKPDERAEYFRKKILPVLKEHCFECHSAEADDVKGKLRVDTREGLRLGGDNGAAVVPNDLEASFLWKAIQYTEDDYKMPPRGKLEDQVLDDFRKWITAGAVDPR